MIKHVNIITIVLYYLLLNQLFYLVYFIFVYYGW